jgi:hypothetical protein
MSTRIAINGLGRIGRKRPAASADIVGDPRAASSISSSSRSSMAIWSRSWPGTTTSGATRIKCSVRHGRWPAAGDQASIAHSRA